LVNDDAETLGVDDAELLAAALELALELGLELEDELPQAETATLAATASAAMIVLLLSKYTINPPSPRTHQRQRPASTRGHSALSQ
jgi:hypothetical protein